MNRATVLLRHTKALTIAIVIAVSAFAVRIPLCSDDYLRSDAADYLRAVQSGFIPSYLDLESTTFMDAVRLFMNKTGPGAYPWDHLYRQGDASALRHFHVPASLYPHAIAAAHKASNRTHRLIAAAIGSVTCGMTAAYLLQAGVSPLFAIGVGAVLAVNPVFVQATTDVSPHPAFLLVSISFLFAFSRFLREGSHTALATSGVLLGIAVAILELSPALIVAAALAYLYTRWRGAVHYPRPARLLIITAATGLAAALIAWPGGFTRGGYLTAYGVFAAQALFRRNELFGSRPGWQIIYDRLFQNDALLAAACVAGVAGLAILVWRKRIGPDIALFALYTVIAFLLNFGNGFRNATYASEVVVFAIIAAGVFFSHIYNFAYGWPKRAVPAVYMGLIVISSARSVPRAPGEHAPDAVAQAIQTLPAIVPSNTTLLVNSDREVYAAYLPQFHFEATDQASSMVPRPLQRSREFQYLIVDESQLAPHALKHVNERYSELMRFTGQGHRNIKVMRAEVEHH
jgi:hypothetical protein